ncbi:MAG: 16S rRNA (adenine(1518)-N(6)/adenine(1519)-N(6))-dimethyltransferase RsmA [Alphaproteobacteria bacterium]|nr:16S rRNA (adenine(1518)-N(6)/adenine(1519)-N(6))-dimethyltransferase RsmA [Alphaproteobacteria bacterium]
MSELDSLPPLKDVIATHGLLARKSLGQHFLLDPSITNRVAAYAGNVSGHYVIEVGPGPGGLTRSILKAGAKQVFAIEKDERCLAALADIKDKVGERLQIIMDDALKVDILKEVPAPRKIVANLPYNVGTLLLTNWLDLIAEHGPETIDSMTLMFQKEVALRITAAPDCRDYGRLSVFAQWLCEVRYDYELPPGAFVPPPKVSSAVVTLTPRKDRIAVNHKMLEMVVAKAFGQRRKMLRVALKGLHVPADVLLEKAGVDGTRRAETLSVAEFCQLADALSL